MGETSLLLDELRERVRRFLEMSARVGVDPEKLAEEALRRFPPREDGEGADLLSERVDRLRESLGTPRRLITAAIVLPPGGARAF